MAQYTPYALVGIEELNYFGPVGCRTNEIPAAQSIINKVEGSGKRMDSKNEIKRKIKMKSLRLGSSGKRPLGGGRRGYCGRGFQIQFSIKIDFSYQREKNN